MKTIVRLLVTLGLVLFVSACDEATSPTKDGGSGNLLDGEKIAKEISAEFTGEDLDLIFPSGGQFLVKANENTGAEKERVVISLIQNERYFNSKNNFVFDFSKMKREFTINFEYSLPTNLVNEDIALFVYSSGSSTEELDAQIINFNYNEQSGLLTAKFKAPSNNPIPGKVKQQKDKIQGGSYNRLVLSYTSREELSENPHTHTVQMPFYPQPGGACWAACAAMMGRAYSAANDRKREMPIIDYLKYMGHSGLSDGIGLYAFKTSLPSAIKAKSGVKFEVSTFLSKTNLLREIMNKINENKPLILKMNYPGIGGHAILIVGYEIDIISAAKISVKLLYHNPQNMPGDAMYKWADFDWLMKDKWMQEAYQILYAEQAAPSNRSLHTVAMPLKDQDGELSFIVPIKRSDGKIKEFPVKMVYNKDTKNRYEWEYALGNVKVDLIPDSASVMRLKLPVNNAAQSAKQLSLQLRAYDSDKGKRIYEKDIPKTCQPGESFFESDISISNFVDNSKETKVRMEIELWEGGTYLDGYTVYFTVPPKLEIELTLYSEIWGEYLTVCPDGSDNSEDPIGFAVSKMKLIGNGTSFKGTSEKIIAGNKFIYNVELELDKANNPTAISRLSFNQNLSNTYSGEILGTGIINTELKNIKFKSSEKQSSYIQIDRSGTEVCDYIEDFTYVYTPKDPDGCTMELTSYNCTGSSVLQIKIE